MNTTGRHILKTRITQHIKDKDYKKLIEALPVAEKYSVSKELMYKGWRLAGQYQEEKKYLTEAIISYNKARRIKPSVLFVFDKIVSLLIELVSKYKTEFSVDDLKTLKESISILENFHSVNYPSQEKVLSKIYDLLLRIDYISEFYPKIAKETKATFQVQKIYNAITDDMTMSEVRQELARTLANIIRREKAKEKKEKKSSVSKKKK